jgi:hypothetical protein
MNGIEMALAVLLLTAPPDAVEITNSKALHRLVASALNSLTLQWELLDARETDYLKNPEDFASDLKLLQGRYGELRSAPKAAEVRYFPERELVNDMLTFNRIFHDNIQSRLNIDAFHKEELQATLAETDHLQHVYEAVRDARCDYYYVTYRRQALAQLRNLVGFENFYNGQLPPHVPMWRIPEDR